MILYFSGTGNSLSVARQLAEATGDTAVHISDLTASFHACHKIRDRVIGFVFPVYFGDLPQPVREFAEYICFAPSTYFYAVATCGSSPGNALHNLMDLLARKRCHLAYARSLSMIANSTATWKKGVTYDYTRLEAAKGELTDIAADINQRAENVRAAKHSLMGSVVGSRLVRRFGSRRLAISVDMEACTGCGLCVRLCPQANISLKNGKARVGDKCISCLACVHWCPSGGMLVHGHPIAREDQYHHPDVKVEDLFRR